MEKLDFSTLTCAEAVKHVARIIHTVHDDIKDKEYESALSSPFLQSLSISFSLVSFSVNSHTHFSLSLSLSLFLSLSDSLLLSHSFCHSLTVLTLRDRLDLGWVCESSGHRYEDVPKHILEEVSKHAREQSKEVEMKE